MDAKQACADSGEALADYLRVALLAEHLDFTIRNDSLPELPSHRRFQDRKLHPYDLRALPAFRFESVVEAPAKRYGVTETRRCAGGERPEGRRLAAAGIRIATVVAPVRGQAPLAQRPFRQDWRPQLAPRFQLRQCRPASPSAGSDDAAPGVDPHCPDALVSGSTHEQGLQELSWAVGRNIQIDYRFGADDPDLLQIQLGRFRPTLVVGDWV
jgi:hypothetical protein